MDRARGRELAAGGHSVSVRAADVERLVAEARAVRANAYAPYSRYRVGAAVMVRDGRIFTGCNVENATYGATLCAERAAIAAMVAAGATAPVACAVVTAGARPGAPCGICRQVFAEFAKDVRFVLVAEDKRGKIAARRSTRLSALLPQAFRLRDVR